MNRIDRKFSTLQKSNQKALIAYLVAGDLPNELTIKVAELWQQIGVNIIEIGVPFSDPMADGPIITSAHTRALCRGHSASLTSIVNELMPAIREVVNTPIVLMGYVNPIIQYGKLFAKDAYQNGVDGVLAVDLSAEEADNLMPFWQSAQLKNICLYAPTTPPSRLPQILQYASGFVYCIALKGVTGADQLSNQGFGKVSDLKSSCPDLYQSITTLKQQTDMPVVAGFGIKDAKQAKLICEATDGVVIGSAFVGLIEKWHTHRDNHLLLDQIKFFTQSIRSGLDK